MATTEKPTEKRDRSEPSTFAGRKAEREAREAAGETQPERPSTTFRAGHDEPQPVMVVTSVRA